MCRQFLFCGFQASVRQVLRAVRELIFCLITPRVGKYLCALLGNLWASEQAYLVEDREKRKWGKCLHRIPPSATLLSATSVSLLPAAVRLFQSEPVHRGTPGWPEAFWVCWAEKEDNTLPLPVCSSNLVDESRQKKRFKATYTVFHCLMIGQLTSPNMRWLGLGGQTMTNLRRLPCKFDFDQIERKLWSHRKSTQGLAKRARKF